MTIQDILDQKGCRVITTAPYHTLDSVLATLIQNSVGALVVQNRVGDLLGIITERDLMREVYNGTDLRVARVEDVMTRDLVTSNPDCDIEYVMAEMTEGDSATCRLLTRRVSLALCRLAILLRPSWNLLRKK